MAPVTFYLLRLKASVNVDDFLSKLKNLADSDKPVWFGRAHHWLHEPHLSVDALHGAEGPIKAWNYLFVTHKDIPSDVKDNIAESWSITADSPEGMPSAREKTQSLLAQDVPQLLNGWSPDDSSGLNASVSLPGLSFSLDELSRPFGSDRAAEGQSLRSFIHDFGTSHPGPVAMFNLLSFLPGKRSVYFDGYVGGFLKTIGPKYGGDAVQFGLGVTGWSSRAGEEPGEEHAGKQEDGGSDGGGWEDAALVWYPSIWHFGKMIDDPQYAVLDREFKPVSLRDNPLVCCTEIEL